MYKTLKLRFRNWKLKKKLTKQNVLFFEEDLVFKPVNVLLIDEIIPEFNKDSGSRRLSEIIKLLLKNDVGVFLLADKKLYRYNSDYINFYKKLGVIVYEPKIYKGKLLTKEDFIKLISPQLNYAWLHRPKVFKRFSNFIKSSNSKTQVIYDMCDFHYVRLLREYEQNKNEETKIEAERNLISEIESCKAADIIFAITDEDKQKVLEHYDNKDKIKVISNVHQPNEKSSSFNEFSKRSNILFIGNFRHKPNIDAVIYLHEKIMPIIWKSHPEIIVDVVGSYPTDNVKTLHSDNFKIHGFVDDVSSYFNSSRIFFAPLRYGAGIKGKIGQSLEYNLPLVTTDVGAEGFDFGNYSEVLIANNAQELAEKVITLYFDQSLWNSVSDYSKTILEPFSLESIETTLLGTIN
ncbi:glycosyltransferase [Psychroserpens sp.]